MKWTRSKYNNNFPISDWFETIMVRHGVYITAPIINIRRKNKYSKLSSN